MVVGLLAVSALCGFVFLASFEPGNGMLWRILYGAVGCGSLSGAIGMSVWRGKDKFRTIIAGSGSFFLAVVLLYLNAKLR